MAQYIEKDALVAEIEKLMNRYDSEYDEDSTEVKAAKGNVCHEILCTIDTLEVKEVDDELQGIEKEVAEGFIERINKKRIPISLKGEKKAKFKNEFNTLWQIINGIQFANVAKHIIERLCLHFAAWGSYNLKGIGQIDKDVIERLRKNNEPKEDKDYAQFELDVSCGYNMALDDVEKFLDTLEVTEMTSLELLKVKGFLVTDKDDYTAIYSTKPNRGRTEWVDGNHPRNANESSCLMTLNNARLLPDIKFNDKPIEVEVVIKAQKGE